MLGFVGKIGRGLCALWNRAAVLMSPSNAKILNNVSRASRKGKKMIGGAGTSTNRRDTDQDTQPSGPLLPTEIPLPDSITVDGLLIQLSDEQQGEQHSDQVGAHAADRDHHASAATSGKLDVETDALVADEVQNAQQDEAIEWTPEMVQAVREAHYITFDIEEAEDYTLGPARIVAATDGVIDCTALLMTLDLSQAVQKAIKAQRDYDKARAAANDKREALLRFQSTLDAQIASHRLHLTMPTLEEDRKAALQTELSTLELMLDEYKLEHTVIQSNLEFQGEMLRKVQVKVNAMLEDAWIDAQLMEREADDPQAPVPEYDLQAEYQAFQRKLQAADDSGSIADAAPLDTSRDHLRHPRTAEEREKEEEADRLHEAVWDAWDRVEAAQAAFDHRDNARMAAEEARTAALQRGEQVQDATSEAFDVHWHSHERELTRELIEAEVAYRVAQKAAGDAGVDDGFADEECGAEDADADDAEDGCCESSGETIAAVGPVDRIVRWLNGIPDPETGSALAHDVLDRSGLDQGDEWEAAELEVGDSVSEIIEFEIACSRNPRRARIDEWQKWQRELRSELESRPRG